MYNDENVIRIKHDVLYEVAKLAFEGTLEEKRDYIPEKLIAAAFTKNGRLSARGCVWQKERI